MSEEARLSCAVSLMRLAVFLADLERWGALPWYQRLITPKPQMPQETPHDR